MGIWNIFARMTLDSSQFEAGAKRVESAAAALGKRIGSYFTAGAIGYGLLSIARDAYTAAGEIADLSDQLGVTTLDIQKMQRAAQEAGVDFGKMADALMKIRKAKMEALSDGSSKSAKAFGALGLDPRSSPMALLAGMGNASNAAQMTAVYDIIGVKSARIVAALKELDGISPLEIIEDDTARKLDAVGTALDKIKREARAITANTMATGASVVDVAAPVAKFWMERNLKSLGVSQDSPTWKRLLLNPVAGAITMANMAGSRAYDIYEKESGQGRFSTQKDDPLSIPARETINNRRIDELRAGYNDPLNFGSFRSSTANSRASIGGFFLGADQTARMDIERQQLQAQKMMADRIDRIEKQVAKITEGT